MRDAIARAKDGRTIPIGFAITPVRKAEMPTCQNTLRHARLKGVD